MTLAWRDRPVEAQGLLNPAFIALVLSHGCAGYAREAQAGLPYPLAFLLLPAVLHPDTREELPGIITTSLPAWLAEHPYLRETFPDRVRSLEATVREGIGYALSSGLLEVAEGGRLEVRVPQTTDSGQSPLTHLILNKSLWVGRWFARAGSATTVYSLWGVRP